MIPTEFHDGRVILHAGDCLDVVDTLADCSVDSVVCDPPYHLTSIVKRFGAKNATPAQEGTDGLYARASRGFMGKEWDGGDIAFRLETWAKVFRVLKPGGHLVAFSAPKCQHRMVCAIEDAGFEIRDGLMWLFGSGFPKSHDVSKGIDKAAGADRVVIAEGAPVKRMIPGADQNKEGWEKNNGREFVPTVTAPATAAAAAWQGWGTALKPAYEPICLARKPLGEKTVAADVLAHGVGGINVDATRIQGEATVRQNHGGTGNPDQWRTGNGSDFQSGSDLGRWPANIVHDGSDEVVATFPETGAGNRPAVRNAAGGIGNDGHKGGQVLDEQRMDSGSAARFFYSAKASASDRIGSKHPTVKPIALMRWLARLVTPPGGVILDPFAGTGTTGEAALREGFRAILIEREDEYRADIARRMEHALDAPADRKATVARIKALAIVQPTEEYAPPAPIEGPVGVFTLKIMSGANVIEFRIFPEPEPCAAGGATQDQAPRGVPAAGPVVPTPLLEAAE